MTNKTLDNLVNKVGNISPVDASLVAATTLGAAIFGKTQDVALFAVPATLQLLKGMYNQLSEEDFQEDQFDKDIPSYHQNSIKDSEKIMQALVTGIGKVTLTGAVGYYILSRIL